MEVKGTLVKSIQDFVKKRYPDQYKVWLKELPEASQNIMIESIYANAWYSMKDAAVIPTTIIAKLFYDNNIEKAAFDAGKFSAEVGLKGVYKIFIRIASPNFIIQRAGRVFATYYSSSEIVVKNSVDKRLILNITKFPEPEKLIEYRIAGWCEKALELTNCKDIKTNITKSMAQGDDITEIDISWH